MRDVQVRRGPYLVQDTLIQIHRAKETDSLKKPLKVGTHSRVDARAAAGSCLADLRPLSTHLAAVFVFCRHGTRYRIGIAILGWQQRRCSVASRVVVVLELAFGSHGAAPAAWW
jgi:hypothetical protein